MPISLSVTVPLLQPPISPPLLSSRGNSKRAFPLSLPVDGKHPRRAPFAILRCFAFSSSSFLELSWAGGALPMQIFAKFSNCTSLLETDPKDSRRHNVRLLFRTFLVILRLGDMYRFLRGFMVQVIPC